ncbi:HXXEE domain-containing protein [Sporolactobacillus sp. THM7-7]|nr:HXXEE domain-containing protein [Sporolactobacillus sp. THM7-7]
MDKIHVLIWLFPILFMFHDFEEIIFMKSWLIKNKYYLSQRFPRFTKKMLSHLEHLSIRIWKYLPNDKMRDSYQKISQNNRLNRLCYQHFTEFLNLIMVIKQIS